MDFRLWLQVAYTALASAAILGCGTAASSGHWIAFWPMALTGASTVAAFGFQLILGPPPKSEADDQTQPIPPDRVDSDLVYDLAKRALDVQLDLVDAIDAKIGMLLSVGSVEIAGVASFLALKPDKAPQAGVVFGLSVVSYVVLAFVAGRALWSRDWSIGPNIATVAEDFRTSTKTEVKFRVLETLYEAILENEDPVAEKAQALRICLIALIVQTIVLLASVILVWGGG